VTWRNSSLWKLQGLKYPTDTCRYLSEDGRYYTSHTESPDYKKSKLSKETRHALSREQYVVKKTRK
jgi:hypothetical protein